MRNEDKPDLTELTVALGEAVSIYTDACKATSVARCRETDALNRLNEVQKALDAGVDQLRRTAPHGSDWNRSRQAGDAYLSGGGAATPPKK